MSKSVKNNAAFFLIAVLVAGIIAISSSSFIDIEASGDKRDHDKHKNYRHDNHKSTDTTIIQKKVTCNNFDININGLNADVSPDDITSDLVATQAQADDDNNNEEISTNSFVDGARNIVKD